MAGARIRSLEPLRWLVAPLAALLLLAGGAADARAAVWTSGGRWVHMHTRLFSVYRTGWDLWALASAAAEGNWNHDTGLRVYYTGDHSTSRIHVIPGGYGDTNWMGLATIESGWNGYGHYAHGHNLYNWYYGQSTMYAYKIACHEMGHSLGLDHSWRDDSCMNAGPNLTNGPSPEDRATLVRQYGVTGH